MRVRAVHRQRTPARRLRFRQGGVGCRQYDIRIDRINDYVLVISGRDTQAQEIDALVSQRVYKPAYTHAEALAMIRRGECGAFDPLLVDCLEDIQGALCREVYGLRGKE